MPDRTIDDISIAALGEPELQRLIDVDEDGGGERKEKPPSDGLAPTVATFAYTAGGWILIGVRDGGEVCGFDVPGRAQAHDWLREMLRRAIDPLPEFRTAVVTTPESVVVVIRIPPSARTPHVLRQKGIVYVRESGAKRPIDSQAKLVAMCEGAERLEGQAVQRLTAPPLVREAIGATLGGPGGQQPDAVVDWIVLAAPLLVPDDIAERLLDTKRSGRQRAPIASTVTCIALPVVVSVPSMANPRGCGRTTDHSPTVASLRCRSVTAPAHEHALEGQLLDAVHLRVGDVDVLVNVEREAVRGAEPERIVRVRPAPEGHQLAVGGELLDAVVP